MANIEEKVEKLVESTIEEMGYDLYDVEYAKEIVENILEVVSKPELDVKQLGKG